ncbi:adenosine deaminase [Methylomonas koyamae]|uniref:Adenosine deaminase n=1 Tax=Methylomonas koyamae TaxID=702114 RepID=A0A177NSD0_9GAMM|nr:CRISPR-associated ring nuclease [Methylomonas koyamae]OAI20885.1 adenosine deaminase [Methylomonas koyamae]
MPNILLCTLGASWAVIPEAYAFLVPDRLPLYRHHPEQPALLSLKDENNLQEPDEIWVCTTQGDQTQTSLHHLIDWVRHLPNPPQLRIWQAKDTDQLASQKECLQIRELILRACLTAHQRAEGGQVVLSLAGGRKTMSADMQWAGSLFGCQALLHVIGADRLPRDFIDAAPEAFTQPLPAAWAQLITPLIAGQTQRSDLLDINVDGVAPIAAKDYPLPWPEIGAVAQFAENRHTLNNELIKRERDSSRLFGNYLQTISRDESHENWRSLYRLPPRRIDQLRTTMLGEKDRDWLIKLPKADLHRHLGGCLSLDAQRRVADAVWQTLSSAERNQALAHCRKLLEQACWPWNWPKSLVADGKLRRAHNAAAILLHANAEQLQHNLWHVTEPRIALKDRHPAGFAAYERPGELSGSALLGHPAAIRPYAEDVMQQATAEGLAYVELRGSPQKYADQGLDFLTQFHQVLTSLPNPTKIQFRFIIIADRRAEDAELQTTIAMAVQAKHQLKDFVVGLDMAGDESRTKPEKIAHLFTPAFEACLPITIHAGEGEAAESIWQAAYHLHADRIGHGLTLNDNPDLAQRFRDRNICLELCPSSNREVVGFCDTNYPETRDLSPYPLLSLWQQGLPITLCTDNPGISQTSLADEYLAAARMVNGLSQWDALAMIKQAFVHAFIPGQEKEHLLKAIDARLYEFLISG